MNREDLRSTQIKGLQAQLRAKTTLVESLKLENARLRLQLKAKNIAKPVTAYAFKKLDMPISVVLTHKASMIGEILPLRESMETPDKGSLTRLINYSSQEGIGTIAQLLKKFLDHTFVNTSFKGGVWLKSIALIRTSMENFGITEEMIYDACGIEREELMLA